MHELGVLCYAVKTVAALAKEQKIRQIKHITLEVGDDSGYVPYYLHKLFPIATEYAPVTKNAELRVITVPGNGLQIKEIGY